MVPNDTSYHFDSLGQRIFVAIILGVVCILGVFGNGLVILACLVSHRLRDATNVFVVNLAIADFLTCLFTPANIIALIGVHEVPTHGSTFDIFCTIGAAVTYISIGVSLYTLASLAVIRFILLTKSVTTYGRLFSSKVVIISWIMLLWFIPAIIVLLPVLRNVDHLGYDPTYHSCSDRQTENSIDERTKDIVLAVGFFLIPGLVLFISYCKIYKHVMINVDILKAKKGQTGVITMKDIKRISKSMELASVSCDSIPRISLPGTPVSGRYRKNPGGRGIVKTNLSRRQVKITKNLFYVLCAFMVCVTPYLILLIFDDTFLAPFAPYAACFLITNSCINWMIYATKHPHFKEVFKCLLSCNWKDIPEPVRWWWYRD
ncbi:putative alpha-1A adrenergic receptor-like [Apostichopus japonicus]|uniref:Putative alpha-1A adrenergic receptor-like n=1 Tax=Stichopus japonicus TaxID=307972 RepID=A0A2G8KEK9_STIJA|nr:putative alpha-1A adrenergic receptor-like [Apostichopus japonicus]